MTTKKTSVAKKAASKKVVSADVAEVAKAPQPSLAKALLIYTKSSSHAVGLVDPKVVTFGDRSFIEGTQSTGKPGHRLEGKKTFIALDNIASFIEFASEEDIWSEPQSKMIRSLVDAEENNAPVLTMHEQGQSAGPRHPHQGGGHNSHFGGHQHRGRRHRHNRNRGHHGPNDRQRD